MLRFALLRSAPWNLCIFAALVTVVIASRSANAQTQPVIFPIPTQVSLPSGAIPLFIGDFNGDGVSDLAYGVRSGTSGTSETLNILLDFVALPLRS